MKKSIIATIVVVVVIVIAAVGAYAILGNKPSGTTASKVTLTETGSTLLYPVFNIWAGNYTANKITTAGTGSGAGIAGAIAGTVIIGASDAYMTNTQVAQNPGMLNVPILISSQYVAYNIPGLNSKTLNFNGTVLAGIYNGSINNWNNAQIAALNPGVTFPNHVIVPVHRSDGSGDTNMFTTFLSKSDSWWNSNVGFGTNVNWPSVPAALTGNGNSGLISQMTSTQYSISYIATTYAAQVQSAGFGVAAVGNQAGQFVTMSPTTVQSAANQYLSQIPPDGRLALQYAPGANSYPIVDLEYLIVKQNQTNTATATALVDFLKWCTNATTGGAQSKFLSPLNLVPLPYSVINQIVMPIINKIGSSTGGVSGSGVTLTETGSTLLYPVFNIWAGNYTANTITTAGTGSGAGIAGAIAGTVIIGASDAFMTDTQVSQNPGMLNVPILISSQYVAYNIPGLNNQTLKFSGQILTGIYNGSINNWNNSQIAAMNPGVTFPSHTIVPVHRSDGSGDTNMFTTFLSKSDSWWNSNVGFGTNVNWPSVPAALTGNGNSGLISQMTATPYSISYIATTYQAQVQSAGFGVAALQNQAGKFVTMSPTTVQSAANQYLSQIPADGRLAIQYAPGNNSYPIVDLEYLIVKATQPNANQAAALVNFLIWSINSTNGGAQSKFLGPLNLVPLPYAVINQIVMPIINKISG